MRKSKKTPKHQTGEIYLDGGWGWAVVLAGFLSQTLIGSVYFGYGVLLPEWMREFESSSALASSIGGTASGMISATGPIASMVIHKWGCRTTHVTGGILISVAFTTCTFANSMIQIFVLYSIVAGIGGGLCYIPSVIAISEYFKHKRSIAVGIVSTGCGFGAFVFPVVFEYLISQYGWRGVMLIAGAINANMIAFGMVMCPVYKAPEVNVVPCRQRNKRLSLDGKDMEEGNNTATIDACAKRPNSDVNENGNKRIEEMTMIEDDEASRQRTRRRSSFQIMRAWLKNPYVRRKSSMRMAREDRIVKYSPTQDDNVFKNNMAQNIDDIKLLESEEPPENKRFFEQAKLLVRNPVFHVLFFHNFTMFVGMMIVYGLTPLRALEDFNMTSNQGAILLSAIGLANTLGRFLWGMVAALRGVESTTLFISLRVTAAIITLISSQARTFALQLLYCISVGSLFGNWSIYPIVVADHFGDELLTVAYGFLESANGLGSIAGPVFGGYLYDISKSYEYSFILSGAVLIIGAAPLVLSRCMHHRTRIISCAKSDLSYS